MALCGMPQVWGEGGRTGHSFCGEDVPSKQDDKQHFRVEWCSHHGSSLTLKHCPSYYSRCGLNLALPALGPLSTSPRNAQLTPVNRCAWLSGFVLCRNLWGVAFLLGSVRAQHLPQRLPLQTMVPSHPPSAASDMLPKGICTATSWGLPLKEEPLTKART